MMLFVLKYRLVFKFLHFQMRAVTDTLICDEDGLYDPGHFNDRLLLGLNRPDTQNTSYSSSY